MVSNSSWLTSCIGFCMNCTQQRKRRQESLKNHYLTALIAHFGVLNKIMYEGFNVHKVFSPLFFLKKFSFVYTATDKTKI